MQRTTELKHLPDDDEIERIAAHYRPVHAPERLPKPQPVRTLSLHTTRRGGLSVVVAHKAGWVGAHVQSPAQIDRVVQRFMDQMLIAHIMGVETAEEPDHAA